MKENTHTDSFQISKYFLDVISDISTACSFPVVETGIKDLVSHLSSLKLKILLPELRSLIISLPEKQSHLLPHMLTPQETTKQDTRED